MKRPSFQFYPADWRKDAALQSCSLSAQGLWINLMCIAHECEPYGHLVVNGKPMTAAQVGRLVGLSSKEADKLLAELLDAGVASESNEGGIYSRRMARDEDLRNRRADGGKAGSEHGSKGAEHGRKGGRPRKQQGDIKTPLDDQTRGVSEPPKEPPPSSSSSSSSPPSSEKETLPSVVATSPPADPEKRRDLSPDEIIFGYGVPLLTASGTPDKSARSFLGKLRKVHGDEAVINTLRQCIKAKPLQPLEWLAKALPPSVPRQTAEDAEAARCAESTRQAMAMLGIGAGRTAPLETVEVIHES